MRTYHLVILFLLIALPATTQNSLDALLKIYNNQSIPYISVEALRQLQTNGEVIVLDSREIEEYNTSHIASAIYIGYSEFSTKDILEQIEDKNAPVVVYCSLGIRSEDISEKLKKAGYMNVKNLYGGIFEWKNNGYPVFDTDNKETENVHTCTKLWSRWLKKGQKVYD